MRVHGRLHRVVRFFLLLAVCLLVLTGCAENAPSDNEGETGLVTSSGFDCPAPNPRMEMKSTSIRIYTWTEYVPADVFECFGLVYGVQVDVDYFSSNEELYKNLSDVQDDPYDVVHPSDYMIGVLIRENMIQELDYSQIPNSVNLDTGLTSAYGAKAKYVMPYQMGTQGIIYNSETVKTSPTSWADLWNPEYQGRIVSVDDSRVVIGAALLTLGYGVNDVSLRHLDEAKIKLQELSPNIQSFNSDSPSSVLLSGDADLGIIWNGEAFLTISEDPRFRYVFPEEGSIVFYDGMAIPSSAAHVDAAYAWLNYLHQHDVNWLALVDYPYTNPNKAGLEFARQNHPDVYNAYISSGVTNTPLSEFERGHEVLDLGDALQYYELLWSDFVR